MNGSVYTVVALSSKAFRRTTEVGHVHQGRRMDLLILATPAQSRRPAESCAMLPPVFVGRVVVKRRSDHKER
jgi:hypothetical protein